MASQSIAPDPSAVPGSPDWWLGRLVRQLMAKQERYDVLERYASGDHDTPNGDRRYVKALNDLQEKAKTNYYGLIARAPVERMRVVGFRFGAEPGFDEDAKMIWAQNDFDYQSQFVFEYGAVYGEAFILVSPKAEDEKYPTLTYESPRTCIVERDPVRPTRLQAGLKLWADNITERVMAVLYLPDAIYTYDGPSLTETSGILPSMSERLLTPANFTPVKKEANPLGDVPFAHVEWQPGCKAEAEDVKTVQDRVNLTMLDRLVISRSQAYRQRWVSGITVPKTKGKNPAAKAPFDPGADILWVTENPETKFGDFEQSDLTMILDCIRDDIIDMAALSKTPAQYLMGRLANISGDTLAQAESGFVSKTKRRMVSAGWGLERAMKLAFKYMNDSRATEVDVEVVWDDPEVRTRAENADATVKEATVLQTAPPFVLGLVMRRLGFGADDIKVAMAEREKYQAEMEAREEMMMDKQAQQAAARGGPAGGGNASTSKKPTKSTNSGS